MDMCIFPYLGGAECKLFIFSFVKLNSFGDDSIWIFVSQGVGVGGGWGLYQSKAFHHSQIILPGIALTLISSVLA